MIYFGNRQYKNPCFGRSSLDRAAALLLCPKNLAYMNKKEEST
jgi:hypothetical protein